MPADSGQSDQELIALLNEGNADGFDGLYDRYRDWVHRLAYRMTGSQDLALDVLQETFSYVLRKFPGFTLTAKFTTFLYPAVKNLSIAARKKAARLSGTDPEVLDQMLEAPESNMVHQHQDLAHALSGIPEVHREVLLLRFVDDLSMEEISQALDIPLGTVKSRLHHGLSKLRDDPRAKAYFLEN